MCHLKAAFPTCLYLFSNFIFTSISGFCQKPNGCQNTPFYYILVVFEKKNESKTFSCINLWLQGLEEKSKELEEKSLTSEISGLTMLVGQCTESTNLFILTKRKDSSGCSQLFFTNKTFRRKWQVKKKKFNNI